MAKRTKKAKTPTNAGTLAEPWTPPPPIKVILDQGQVGKGQMELEKFDYNNVSSLLNGMSGRVTCIQIFIKD